LFDLRQRGACGAERKEQVGIHVAAGLAWMSEACGISYDVLAWTMEWYMREETLREANTAIVNHHYGLELSKVFGGGTMSSSDGAAFPCPRQVADQPGA
jgi:hypothetical protein